MKKHECEIGKKVGLVRDLYPDTSGTGLGVGVIKSSPKREGYNVYKVKVQWSNGRVLEHPITRLLKAGEVA